VRPLKNKTAEPENSMPTGTNATNALSNVRFMATPTLDCKSPQFVLKLTHQPQNGSLKATMPTPQATWPTMDALETVTHSWHHSQPLFMGF
jgi:hypothetical protein